MVTIGKLWLEYDKHHLTATRSPWRSRISWQHLETVFKNKRPDRLQPIDFATFFSSRGPVSEGTLNRDLSVLQAIISYARKAGLTNANPHIPKFKSPPARKRVLSDLEIADLLKACLGDDALLTFVQLALLSGQRREAIIKLKWLQVDFTNSVIDFRDREELNAGRMKGRGVIPIVGDLAEVLEALRAKRDPSNPFVIGAWSGRISCLRHAFNAAAKKAGFSDVTPHTLRHTVATRLIKRGVPLLKVSQLLGHASIITTERNYMHVTPDYIAEAAAQLSIK